MTHARTAYAATIALITCALIASAAPRAAATPIGSDGFSIKVSEGLEGMQSLSAALLNPLTLVAQDRPQFVLTNTSTDASIVSFTLTINNADFRVGTLMLNNIGGINITGASPGTTPGQHAGATEATLGFESLGPGFIYPFRVDIDRADDGGMSLTNYREALASGGNPNFWATVDVTFSDGQSLHQMLTPSDISGTNPYVNYQQFACITQAPATGQINVSAQTTPVPEPASVVTAGIGAVLFAALALARSRRAQMRA